MKRSINPGSIRAPFAQYSHAVEVPAGRMLFASGQLGVSPDDQVPEHAEAQAVLCFENIKAILAEAGMSFADVVRFTAYVTDRAYFPVYGAVRSRYVSGNAFASTLVIVSGFTRPEFKVEVEVTAVRGDLMERRCVGGIWAFLWGLFWGGGGGGLGVWFTRAFNF